jgi:hypothetical protein
MFTPETLPVLSGLAKGFAERVPGLPIDEVAPGFLTAARARRWPGAGEAFAGMGPVTPCKTGRMGEHAARDHLRRAGRLLRPCPTSQTRGPTTR